ncbi:MAG: hypothetical protein SF123_15215 [Chloroflexota bacterium]|nr:hypothetical protein [Chloroflexota bacterium]
MDTKKTASRREQPGAAGLSAGRFSARLNFAVHLRDGSRHPCIASPRWTPRVSRRLQPMAATFAHSGCAPRCCSRHARTAASASGVRM